MGATEPVSVPGPFGVRLEAPRFVQIAIAAASDDTGTGGDEVVYALDAEGGVWRYVFVHRMSIAGEWVPLDPTRGVRR